MMTRSESGLYHAGVTTIFSERPSAFKKLTDYMQFLACNAVVDMFDFQRSVRAFMDSDLGLGVIFGATATVFCFILSGAGW